MEVPGTCVSHALIDDKSRNKHGDEKALEEAVRRIWRAYMQAIVIMPVGMGTKIHVTLTVEGVG